MPATHANILIKEEQNVPLTILSHTLTIKTERIAMQTMCKNIIRKRTHSAFPTHDVDLYKKINKTLPLSLALAFC
jgi:hypothetical protein